MGRLLAWQLPGGPVGPPARWAATSNVEGRSGKKQRPFQYHSGVKSENQTTLSGHRTLEYKNGRREITRKQ